MITVPTVNLTIKATAATQADYNALLVYAQANAAPGSSVTGDPNTLTVTVEQPMTNVPVAA